MEELIKALKQVSINESTDIPIELVEEIMRVRMEINTVETPKFINTKGELVNAHWDDYKRTGLNNMDYIMYKYYLENEGE
jgi:hypothetical protein